MTTEIRKLEDERRRKGIEIAKRGGIQQRGDSWLVPSESKSILYIVYLDGENSTCKCPFFEKNKEHKELCKHIFAAEYYASRMTDATSYNGGVLQIKRKVYPRNWIAYDETRSW